MSKTLLNRLAMFEVLDAAGPMTVSELAHRSGLDVAVVSRTVAACERDGWLTRADGKIAIGPRATLLGHFSPFGEVIARAVPLIHAVAGVTGLVTQASCLVGDDVVLIATAAGRDPGIPPGLAARAPLYATAAGHTIAIQLDAERLDAALPPEPFPDAATIIATMAGTTAEPIFTPAARAADARTQPPLAHGRDEFQARLDAVRADGYAVDSGALDPAISCVAVPWPQPGFPCAFACLGLPGTISADVAVIRHVLTLAAQPGSTPNQIIAGAADVLPVGTSTGH